MGCYKEGGHMIKRRHLLGGAAVLAGQTLVPASLFAQQRATIRVEKLNYFEIRVSNPARSLAFYQGLFGLPVQSRSGGRLLLKIGEDNQFMAIRQLRAGEMPAITELGYSVPDYDPQALLATLAANGFRQISAPDITLPGIDNPAHLFAQATLREAA